MQEEKIKRKFGFLQMLLKEIVDVTVAILTVIPSIAAEFKNTTP